jgi:site-specific recombinase XerD
VRGFNGNPELQVRALCRMRHSRRTYATFLKAKGEDVKTVRELLRHADSLGTMNLDAQELTNGFQKVVKIKTASSNDPELSERS